MGRSSTKSFILYFISFAGLAVISVFFLRNENRPIRHLNALPSSSTVEVWPELELSWRSATATLIGFLGSAFGTVGGVGGGGIFVPMLNLIVGFDTKSAAALSKCMIMGASMSSVWYNVRVTHPTKDAPIIDYDLALLFQPMLMLGITIGVSLSVVFPYWLITVLTIILFLGTSSRSFFRAIIMWKHESYVKMVESEAKENQASSTCSGAAVIIDSDYQPLLPPVPEKSPMEVFYSNIKWKGVLVLITVWSCFLVLQIIKTNSANCGWVFWIVNLLQFPVAVIVFGWEATKLYKDSKERRLGGNWEYVCGASIEWSVNQLLFCALCGLLGGTVGGLLGSGGGFILGPLLLEIGVIPQVIIKHVLSVC